MNRGFITYFSEAIKSSFKTIFKNKGFLTIWLYTIMELVGRCTFVLSPVFDLANIRQAKTVHAYNRADVSENFRHALRANALWSLWGAYCLEALIFLAGIILIGIATGFLALIGFMIGYAAPDFPQEFMVLIFCTPGAAALLVYFAIMPIMFAPTPYIVESNPGIGAAAAVSASIKTMRRCGKWTCFLNFFVPSLIMGAIVGFGAGAIMLVLLFLEGRAECGIVLCCVIFLFAAIFLAIFPIFYLTYKVSEKSLFEDIALDPVNAGKHTSGVNIRRCKGVLFEPETIEENLSVLFDETDNLDAPLPASGARRKHEKSARAGAKKVNLSDEETDISDGKDES